MKTIKIYVREITVRTGFSKYRFKSEKQFTVQYDGQTFRNHYEDITNPRLRVKFDEILNTRSASTLRAFQKKLGKTNADKELYSVIEKIING